MINSITSMDCHVVVAGGYTSAPYINAYGSTSAAPCFGYVRVNGGNYEAYDGSSWQYINTQPVSVGLTPTASMAISWAIQKQAEEIELNRLCGHHPELQQAKEQFDNIVALTKQLEQQRKTFEEQLKVEQGFVKSVVSELEKVTADRNDLKEKLDGWKVLTS